MIELGATETRSRENAMGLLESRFAEFEDMEDGEQVDVQT